MNSGPALTFSALALLCLACIPPRLTDADGGAAGTGAAGTTGVAGTTGAAGTGAAGTGAATAGTTGAAGATLKVVTVPIAADEDDALWIRGDDERLHYAANNPTIEVGADAEQARAGLRFQVAVPVGATIMSAAINVHTHSSKIDRGGSIEIRVYDSVDVAPFDDGHTHRPEQHDGRGLASRMIDGFIVQFNDVTYTTPDIRELVQRVVDRNDWTGTGNIGFVLSPQQGEFATGEWVAFNDSSSGSDRASLTIRYVAP